MGPQKQEDRVESAYHVWWDFSVEAYSLSAGRETEDQWLSQRVEVDATPPSLVGSVSVRTSPDVTPGGDHVASFDAEQVKDIDENVELFVAIGTKIKL